MPRGNSTEYVWDPETKQYVHISQMRGATSSNSAGSSSGSAPTQQGGTSKGGHPSPWTPFNVNEKKFTTDAYPAIDNVTYRANEVLNDAQDRLDPVTGQIINMAGQPAPQMTGPDPRPRGKNVGMPGRADASAVEFYDPFRASKGDSRDRQTDVFDAYGTIASGEGPSVAGSMVQGNAQTTATDIKNVTLDAGDAYGASARAAAGTYDDASSRAAFDYQNASAEQRYAFEQAAKNASAETKLAAENAIREAASLAAGARANNIGGALLSAQGNAAFQMTDAQRRAAQIEETARMAAGKMASDQQRAAAFNAAGVQRQAAAGQQLADATTASNATRGVIAAENVRAQGDIAAGQIRSRETMDALAAQTGLAGAIRAGDQGDAGLALNKQSGDLAVDTLSANVQAGNMDREVRVAEAWQQMEQQAKATNVGAQLTAQGQAYNALQGVMATQAGREAMGLALQGNFAQLAAQMGMSAQQLNAQVYGQAQALGVAWQTASDAAKMQLIGSIISGVATVGGVIAGAAIGGPAGAVAGGAAGNAVGGTVAGAVTGR